MIKQYLSIKEQYPDAILFYRMGDFYEMFFEDAHLASRILEITLTSRNKNDDSPVPMCGFPHRAARGYIAKLIRQGYKVAICDQVEDPAKAQGLVKRDVVRVITPGMIIENELLDERANNYVLAVACKDDFVGIAYLDISTGTFRVAQSRDSASAIEEIRRVAPSEALLAESSKNDPFFSPITRVLSEVSISYLDNKAFEHKRGYERLTAQFKTVTLEGFGCENMKAAVCAAGAVFFYVRETQKQRIEHLTRIETYWLDKYLLVDNLSRQNLELFKNIRTGTRKATLLSVIDRTVTAMGARLLANWLRYPLVDPDAICLRLDAVYEVKENIQIRRSIREKLKSVYDIERIGSKIVMGQANARDMVALKRSLEMLPGMWSLLAELKTVPFRPPAWPNLLSDRFGRMRRRQSTKAESLKPDIRKNWTSSCRSAVMAKAGWPGWRAAKGKPPASAPLRSGSTKSSDIIWKSPKAARPPFPPTMFESRLSSTQSAISPKS